MKQDQVNRDDGPLQGSNAGLFWGPLSNIIDYTSLAFKFSGGKFNEYFLPIFVTSKIECSVDGLLRLKTPIHEYFAFNVVSSLGHKLSS